MSREILDEHRELWQRKTLTRRLYAKWFGEVRAELKGDGPVVEIGSGTGNFKEFMPSAIASDIVPCGWLDVVHDALALPYGDSTVSDFVLIDAIHHVREPARAVDEMLRCLKPGGRIVVYDVYISAFSYIYYNYLHKEDVDLKADVFAARRGSGTKRPFDSNQAVATLLFFKGADRFRARWPSLEIVKRELKEFLLYPLSGGFESPQLAPTALARLIEPVDRIAVRLFGGLVAARCFVVIEKTGRQGSTAREPRQEDANAKI